MGLAFRPLALAVVALLAVGCVTHSDFVTNRPWGLTSIDGQAPAADARIEFGDDGQMTVQPGCNSGAGPYTFDFNHIRIGEMAIPALSCADDAANTQEAVILAGLRGNPTFTVDTGAGELRLERIGTTLVFVTP
jgi:heat shock protein HslJ